VRIHVDDFLKHCQGIIGLVGVIVIGSLLMRQFFPASMHQSVSKSSGSLCYLERWHNTVRQRLGRYVRKTLSFSKSKEMHELVTQWFIVEYNLPLSPYLTTTLDTLELKSTAWKGYPSL